MLIGTPVVDEGPLHVVSLSLLPFLCIYVFLRDMTYFDVSKVNDSFIFVHLQITNEVFDGVTVRVYRPKKDNTIFPGLMYYHGGGWAIGNISK